MDFIKTLSFLYRLFMDIYKRIKHHLVALICVLTITAYGIFCDWIYFNLPVMKQCINLADFIFTYFIGTRGLSLFWVSVIGIWLNWSGFNRLINASRDSYGASIGYMKITGGAVLIGLMHFFLIFMR
jgi:hypothetical protein